jgi:tetratricopeptide (TPR) repeat protein
MRVSIKAAPMTAGLVPALALVLTGASAWAQATGGGTKTPSQLVERAQRKVRAGSYEAAIRDTKAALKRDEKYTPAMEVMARAYYHLGKNEFAEAICDIALGINANSGLCYNLKGFVSLRLKDAPRALEMFKKATEVNSDYGIGWLNLGARYIAVKNYREAVPALEKAADLLPDRAEAHLNLGAAYRGAGQLEKAQKHLNKALRLRPNYPAAFFNLGILFLDAETYPNMDKLQQLQLAVANLNKYKQLQGYKKEDDPVDSYLKSAERAITREQRRIKREERRKAREAERKAKEAAEAAAKESGAGGDSGEGGEGAE